MKRALSLILAIIMVVGLIPSATISIFAATNEVTLSSTDSADYTDLNAAINAVDDGGTIKIVGTYTYATTYAWTDHNKTVTITGDGTGIIEAPKGTINIHDSVTFTALTLNNHGGSIYANGNPLTIEADVNIPEKVNIISGGNDTGKEINGNTSLKLYAGSYTFIMGGSYGGKVNGNTHVTIGGNVNSLYTTIDGSGSVANVYGGGYGKSSSPVEVTGNSSVTITGNARANNVVGGVMTPGTVYGDSSVTMDGGDVYRIIGGGRGANANNTVVNVTGGNVRYIFGGCYNATVTGNTTVYVGGTTNKTASDILGECVVSDHANQNFRIFGGGYSQEDKYPNSVEGNTYVTVAGEVKANGVYGGGDAYSTGVGKTAYVNILGGEFMTVYGGGYKSPVANAVLTFAGGTAEQVFGGSESAAVTGNTLVRVLGGTITRRLYGGSYNEYDSGWTSEFGVAGTSAVVISDKATINFSYSGGLITVDKSIYAGSRHANNVDGNEVLAFLDAAAKTKYSGKLGAQDTIMKGYMDGKAAADEIHTLSHAVNGNVITETCTDDGCTHNATVSLVVADGSNLNYNGTAIKPAVIKYSEGWLAEEIGTEITYANNNKVGLATATATHARLGDITLEFEITENIIEVYNEDKEGDDKVSFKSLIGTTLAKYTTYKLMENIDLGGGDPIASYITLATGVVFDGNGHSVTGFSLKSGSSAMGTNVSLFKATGSATVKDLTLGSDTSKIKVDMVNGGTSYAVVMADIPGGTTQTFDNITVYTTMVGDTTTTVDNRRGGAIIGRVYGTVILTDCKTYGSIEDTDGKTGFGGFIGLIPADVQVTITDCTNNISIDTKRMAGGFIGQSCTAKLTMSGCVNNGNITLTDALAGGFMGQFYSNTATKNANSITDCTNNGDIIGTSAIGGFAGEWNSKAKANKGTLTLTGFNQSGAVKATNGEAGGIIGKFLAYDDLTVNNLKSDNTGSVEATGRAGGIFGYSADVPSAGVTVTVNGGSSANSVTSTGSHAGGVVGYAAVLITYNISNYTNNGTVTTTAANQNAGGLFGQVKTVKPLTVNKFINAGNIVSKNNGAAIIGQYDSPTSTASFVGCKNIATITAQSGSAGMIVGWGSGTVAITVENCVNSGAISGAGRAGGFFGGMTSNSLSVKNSKNMAAITGTNNNAGGFAGDYTVNGAASVQRFENYGAVNTSKNHAGGFAGVFNVKADASLDEIVNNGVVSTKDGYAAAVFGQLNTNGYSVTIEDVLNTGSVTSNKKATVIVSWMGAGSISVNRGINFGKINSAWNSTGTFGFSEAATESITVTNCVNLGETKKGTAFYPIWYEGVSETYAYNNDFGSTNMYLASLVSNDMPTNGATAIADLDAALKLLNNETYSVWNGFKASDVDENGKATGIVLATPSLYGVQTGKTVTDGKTSLRFVGTIQDTLRYSEIGIVVTLNDKPITVKSRYVYEHLTAVGADDGIIKYSAADMGGRYAFALTVTDVPVTGTFVFTVKPYAIDTDGTRYDNATAYDVTFTDGAVVSVSVSK